MRSSKPETLFWWNSFILSGWVCNGSGLQCDSRSAHSVGSRYRILTWHLLGSGKIKHIPALMSVNQSSVTTMIGLQLSTAYRCHCTILLNSILTICYVIISIIIPSKVKMISTFRHMHMLIFPWCPITRIPSRTSEVIISVNKMFC